MDTSAKIVSAIQLMYNLDSTSKVNRELIPAPVLAILSNWFPEEHIRSQGYYEKIVPRYSDADFRSHFRLTRSSVEVLLQKLSTSAAFQDITRRNCGKEPVDLLKSILITLWLVGSSETYRSIGDRFNVAKSTVYSCLSLVRSGVLEVLGPSIKWPSIAERTVIAQEFEGVGLLPGAIGAIDGTFIPIPAPKQDQESYYNRKKFHAVILQAVCTPNMAFSDCYVGWPGSCHDARVLRNSQLYQTAASLCSPEHYIIGDPAYPIRPWLMVAYKENGHLTESHRRFNKALSKMRVVIEQAFSLLKGRFRRLKFLDIRDMKEVNETVMMCCILHNMCCGEA